MERDLSTASESVRARVLAIKARMGDGTAALLAVGIFANLTRFGSNLVLTRLLAPEAFGIIAIVNSIQTVLNLMTDLAIRPFYARQPVATETTLRTVWTVKFLRDSALAVATFAAAGPLAGLFGHPEAAPALRACAAILALESIKSHSLLVILRERRLYKISLYDLLSQLVATAATVGSALILKSYWAIVIGMVVSHVGALIASYTVLGRRDLPTFQLDRRTLSDLWKMARVTLPSSVIALVLTQVDRIYFGRTFPISELGFYALAMTIVTAVSAMTQRYIANSYFPKTAQIYRTTPSALKVESYRIRWRFTLVMFFALGGLMATGDLAAQLLFEDKYLRVGTYIGIICIGPLGELLRSPSENVLVATGFFRATLLANVMRLVFIAFAAPFAYFQFGPIAVLYALVLSEYVPVPFFWRRLSTLGYLDLRWEGFFVAGGIGGFIVGTIGQWLIFRLVDIGWLPHF